MSNILVMQNLPSPRYSRLAFRGGPREKWDWGHLCTKKPPTFFFPEKNHQNVTTQSLNVSKFDIYIEVFS